MKTIDHKEFVDTRTLKTYDEIDGLKVIEELLLTKGEAIAGATRCVLLKHLEEMALVVYNLKSSATNKLYVGMRLDKFYLRNGMVTSSGKIKVPADIYDRVKEINDSYRTKAAL